MNSQMEPPRAASHIKRRQDCRPRVLVIDDDPTAAELIVRSLTQERITPGALAAMKLNFDYSSLPTTALPLQERPEEEFVQFDAESVHDTESAVANLEGDRFDLFYVDLVLRPVDRSNPTDVKAAVDEGRRLIYTIRKKSRTAGIIVLSGERAQSTTVDTVVDGANFYLEKPLDARDIRRAAASLWERVQHSRPRGRITIGEWWFSFGSRTLLNHHGEKKRLAPLEYAFLEQLLLADDHEIDRASFSKRVLGYELLDGDRRMDSLKKRLAKKLGETVQIVQVRDRGYRLLGIA